FFSSRRRHTRSKRDWSSDVCSSDLSTGIGWHEARVPTIVTSVPRAAFTELTGEVRKNVSIPVVASNRINMPDVAEGILQRDEAEIGRASCRERGRSTGDGDAVVNKH